MSYSDDWEPTGTIPQNQFLLTRPTKNDSESVLIWKCWLLGRLILTEHFSRESVNLSLWMLPCIGRQASLEAGCGQVLFPVPPFLDGYLWQ